jgi:hypothetical protein
MDPISIALWVLAGSFVLLAGTRFLPDLLAGVLAPWIRRDALARLPDTIRLVPLEPVNWRDGASAEGATRLLVERGFAPAGDFAIEEIPGMHVRLLAHESERWYAVQSEHPLAGGWFDLVRRFDAETSVTWTTAPPTGLEERPGHPIHRVPGAHPGELFDRARRESPVGSARPATRQGAREDFEAAYAESIRWRKRCAPLIVGDGFRPAKSLNGTVGPAANPSKSLGFEPPHN